jgi:hypothetical protein
MFAPLGGYIIIFSKFLLAREKKQKRFFGGRKGLTRFIHSFRYRYINTWRGQPVSDTGPSIIEMGGPIIPRADLSRPARGPLSFPCSKTKEKQKMCLFSFPSPGIKFLSQQHRPQFPCRWQETISSLGIFTTRV